MAAKASSVPQTSPIIHERPGLADRAVRPALRFIEVEPRPTTFAQGSC